MVLLPVEDTFPNLRPRKRLKRLYLPLWLFLGVASPVNLCIVLNQMMVIFGKLCCASRERSGDIYYLLHITPRRKRDEKEAYRELQVWVAMLSGLDMVGKERLFLGFRCLDFLCVKVLFFVFNVMPALFLDEELQFCLQNHVRRVRVEVVNSVKHEMTAN